MTVSKMVMNTLVSTLTIKMTIFLLELWFFAIINARCWDVFQEYKDVGLELMSIKCHALRVRLHCRQRCDCSACRDTPSTSAKGPVLWPFCQPPARLSFLDECHPASPADASHLHVALAVAWWQMQTGSEKAKWKDQTGAVLQGVWWLLPQPLWRLGKGTEYLRQVPPSVCGALCFKKCIFDGLLCALLTVILNCSVKTHAWALLLCRNKLHFPDAFTILFS